MIQLVPKLEPESMPAAEKCKYKRILLKLSGEALMGGQKSIDPDKIGEIADQICNASKTLGVQVAVVVGGGNIFRGVQGSQWGMDKAAADYVGMLATIMNALILQEVLNQKGMATRVQTAIAMPEIAEQFIRLRAIRHLQKDRVVIFGGGTGNPHVTTDTAAALRAAEIKADAILMAKNKIDGIYDDDPRTNPNAKRYETITFDSLLREGLKVMDPAAVSLCQQNNIPIVVFDFAKSGSVERIIKGENVGTLVNGGVTMSTSTEGYTSAEKRMKSAIETLKKEFATIRTGRANPALLDRVEVEYYGAPTPLKQVANITVTDARTIIVQAFDKSAVKEIEKAITASGLGLTPNVDGGTIRINIPALTEERRKEMNKVVRKYAEDGRVAVRNVRRDAIDELKKTKGKEVSEDEYKRQEDSFQKLTDKCVKEIDDMTKQKEAEVMEV